MLFFLFVFTFLIYIENDCEIKRIWFGFISHFVLKKIVSVQQIACYKKNKLQLSVKERRFQITCFVN